MHKHTANYVLIYISFVNILYIMYLLCKHTVHYVLMCIYLLNILYIVFVCIYLASRLLLNSTKARKAGPIGFSLCICYTFAISGLSHCICQMLIVIIM